MAGSPTEGPLLNFSIPGTLRDHCLVEPTTVLLVWQTAGKLPRLRRGPECHTTSSAVADNTLRVFPTPTTKDRAN